MSILSQAIIASLVLWFVFLDYEFLHLWTYRPIVLGPLMGFCLGNLGIGLQVGATMELMFLATVWVGSATPPNEILSTGIATALAVTTGDPTIAIATAIPLALLGTTLVTFKNTVVHVFALHKFEGCVAKLSRKGMIFWGILFPIFITHTVLFVIPTFVAIYFGSDVCTQILTAIPSNVLAALNCGGMMVGAVGLALLMVSIDFKRSWPFFFLGFIFAAYLGIGTLGLTIIAVIVIAIIYRFRKPQVTV